MKPICPPVLQWGRARSNVRATWSALAAILWIVGGLPWSSLAQVTNVGNALSFDGTTNAVVIASAFQGFPSATITVEFWARSTDSTKDGSLFSYGAGGEPNSFLVHDQRNLSLLLNSSWRITTGIAINDGAWHHVAIAWSTSGPLQLFKDGTLAFSTNRAGIPLGDGGTLVLGQDQDIIGGGFDAAEAFLGDMDEVRVWSVVRTSAQIAQNLNVALAGNDTGLVAYYRFNEGLGARANDASGLGHHGTLGSGVNWLPHAPYNPGSALDIANGSVRIPSSPSFNTLPITIMTWLRASGTTLKARWALTRGTRDAFDWVIMLEPNGTLSAQYLATLSTGVSIYEINGGNGGPVNDELWHHVAFTVDNSGGRLYVDGILKASRGWFGAPAANNSANVAYIGSPDFPFNGQLDEVSLWNVALSPAAIQANMNRKLTGAESGLLAVYHLDEGTGTLVTDSSAGVHHGTILSNCVWTTSGARLHGTAQLSGRVTALGNGWPNIPVIAALPPLTVPAQLAIPDGGTSTSINSINTQRGAIGSVKVAVNITHAFAGDLELTLIHPDGTEVRLKDADSVDESENLLTSYPEATAPVQSLDTLKGKSVAGLWRLRVRDAFPMDTGTLNSWSLQFGGPAGVTDANGRYAISNLLSLNNLFADAYSVQPVRDGFVFDPLAIMTPHSRTNVDFTVVSGSIDGHVMDKTTPFPGATISAEPGLSTISRADGSYRLSGLPPGIHTLSATAPGYGFKPPQLSDLALGVTGADFSVLGYPVSGRITDVESNGVAGVTVTSSNGGQPGTSDSEGNYTISAAIAGSSFITPAKLGATFSPASRRMTVGPALSNVNFSITSSPPVITTIPSQVIAKGSSTAPLRFDVNDLETRPAFLQLAGTSSNTNLVPTANIVFGGVGIQRTVKVTPVAGQAGTTHITVVVTDEAGLSASKTFVVRVNQAPLPGVGRALTFNGLPNSVRTANRVIVDKGTFTVEAWASAPSNSAPRTLLAQGDIFCIRVDGSGQIRIGTNWNTGVPFPFGDWHHLAVVRETANTRLYIDGVLRATQDSPLTYPRQNIPFLVGSLGSSEYWLGGVDEVRVWYTARSAVEIASYAKVRVMGNEENLGALWRLDETTPEWALDSSPYGQLMSVAGPGRSSSAIGFDSYVTLLGRNINDTLQGFDPDDDALTFTIVSQPTRGTVQLLSRSTGEFLYTADGAGQDQFTFTVSDGYATSEAHPVNITTLPDTNAPTISFIADQVIAEDTALGPLAFTVGDSERSADLLTVVGSSSDQSLVPNENISISGDGANRFVTLQPATNAFGSALITLTVSDGSQQSTSSFALTVTPVHDPPTVTMTNMEVGNGQLFSQPIQVWAPDRSSTAPLTYSVSVFPVAGLSGQISAAVGQCSSDGSTVPCVTMTSIADRNYYGTNRVTVTVNDGLSSGQTSFFVFLRSTPVLPAIPDQHTLRDIPTKEIDLITTIPDWDTPFPNLALTFSYSNPALVDSSSFQLDIYHRLVLVPRPGAFGQSAITLTISDGVSSSSNTFQFVVENPVNYQVVELPALPGAQGSDNAVALRLNDHGQAVGWSELGGLPRAVLWDVNGSTPTVTSLFNTRSVAYDINNRGQIVGHSNNTPFFYNNGTSTTLGGVVGSSYAGAINDSGEIVGAYDTGLSRFFYFNGTQQIILTNVFFTGSFPGEQRGLALNALGDVFGGAVDLAAGYQRQFNALLWTNRSSRTTLSFPSLTADWLSRPVVGGINNTGWVCVNHWYQPQNQYFPILFNYRTSTTNSAFSSALAAGLPELFRSYAFARDLNDSSQVVGYGETFSSGPVPFLYTDGKVYRLAELMVGSGISPLDARAINTTGDIVGYGTKPGATGYVPFLLRNRVFVGEPQSPPDQAINPADGKAYAPPTVSALDGTAATDVANAYVWSEYEQKLFFVRPILAAVTWATSPNTAGAIVATTVRRLRVDWPRAPQIHVASAPADAGPVSTAWPHRPLAVSYSTAAATLDPSTRTFNAPNPGYSVIRYLIAAETPLNVPPDPLTHSNYFEVVRTLAWNDSAVLNNNVPATVGVKVTDPRGPTVSTNSFKSGWTIFPIAPYDGVGADRAYDRSTQTGPIIPVNQDTSSTNDDLVVAYYKRNPVTGVLWPDLSVRYNISWPANAEKLVIANSAGSGPLPESQYPDKRVYFQTNPNLPGYNPNEEHAFLAATSSGQGVFALRNDLNRANTSSNYVLLKYRNPSNGEWQFKIFQPVLTDATHGFTFSGDAGLEILPPKPVGFFTICAETTVISGATNVFRDHRGKFYARTGATPAQPNPQVVMRYFYPLQADFFYDRDGDGINDVDVGDCVRWDAIAPGASDSLPVDVTYRLRWPDDPPTLQIGETLLNPKRRLPGIKNWASAQVVYDSLNPDGQTPLMNTARLYDPLSARVLRVSDVVGAGYEFPAEIAQQTVNGKQIFSGLPYHLRARLSYDPINKTISFAGVLDDHVLGEPLLLVNVMSAQERLRILQLSNEENFQRIINRLYNLTRNPNDVNVANPGQSPADEALLIGFTTAYTVLINNGGTVTTQDFFGRPPTGNNIAILGAKIVQEPLGDAPKALTAGLPVPGMKANFGDALALDGTGAFVSTPQQIAAPQTFTMSVWFKTSLSQYGVLLSFRDTSVGNFGAGDRDLYLDDAGALNFYIWDVGPHVITSASGFSDGQWHHAAATLSASTGMRLYADGNLVAADPNVTFAYTYPQGGYWRIGESFQGTIDDLQIWNVARTDQEIQQGRGRPLTGGEPGLHRYWRFDDPGKIAFDSSTNLADAELQGNAMYVPSTLSTGEAGERYVVLAENNDPALGGLPVNLHVIRVEGGPFRGDLKVILPDNVFDERLTLRHSSDFGADPDRLEFEWWYHPDDADFVATELPTLKPDGSIDHANGWLIYAPALHPNKSGQNTITIGEGSETSQFTLADNWFISRYRGYEIGGQTKWSDWVGDPASAETTRAALAPGWIKRVIEGINLFDARTTNFHETAASTFASMLTQAGERYEGDVALNPSGENLSSIGLIAAYTTVLNRGRHLSIDGLPPVDSDPLNNALLLAASRISDLYMLLGNEAFADAQDPTIGFFSDSFEFGSLATATFAFKNQLDSQLEEEITLLRGRDDSAAGVGAPPVYNRLLWNFTGSEGEVAYERTYNVGDVNLDGVINENDAKILFPQGHGDAWGHYLTALTTYYELLRHPHFTWVPRTESVSVAGAAVRVDFLDERKFAIAAAAKAKAGTEILDLTYRSKYVDDPAGQYQGYKDTRTDRAWGVVEWARRAGQGTYFDWLVGNAILPSSDPNTNHVGLQKVDRQTVLELEQITSEHREMQARLDSADAGLNPLGLAKGAVAFDIDPSFSIPGTDVQGQRHFQQIYDRAVNAMNNCVALWNQANQFSEALRHQQDDIDEFTGAVADQERDFKNRLIEVYGYPYAGDIGGGKTYPSGYDGPDLYHWMYVGTTELTGTPAATRGILTRTFAAPVTNAVGTLNLYFDNDLAAGTVLSSQPGPVQFPLANGDWAFSAPADYGARRAPGEIQLAISDLVQEETRLKQSLRNYDNLVKQLQDAGGVLQSQANVNGAVIQLLKDNRTKQVDFNTRIQVAQTSQLIFRRLSSVVGAVTEAMAGGLPETVLDIPGMSSVSSGMILAGIGISQGLDSVADIAEGAQDRLELDKEEAQLQTDIDVETTDRTFEFVQRAAELKQLLREEAPLRLECFNQAELVKQTYGRLQAAVASAERLKKERTIFRQRTAGTTQQNRYKDMAFRIFRNEALQKYRAQFDLASRYVYLAASAYDYELNFLGTDTRSGRDFFTDIVRQRNIGQMIDGDPIPGSAGLADALGRLKQNFEVLESRFGLNNPQLETARFSLRKELFRIRDDSDQQWRAILKRAVVADLWQVPAFRRYCRPFAPESAGPQPGMVIHFPTTITFGLNFFGFQLGGGDSAYDPSLFTTKINSVGVWFENYTNNASGLATAPRVYLIPAGMDIQRSPTGNTLATREWKVLDQAIPIPFPIGASDLTAPSWIPMNDSLPESFAQIRRFSSFRAYHDAGVYDDTQTTKDTRLIGRSVWNTDWILIIPGGTFLFDPDQGLETFINSVSDIKLALQSYSYAGD
ncbi:MAG TPA: LamG-like jellyroll fold domain-containing protein [Verrucomicrobiae bacterium]|nr:LamG-like jellyroll fold domain-containing protein [Verrucomicrobiae bacterium]